MDQKRHYGPNVTREDPLEGIDLDNLPRPLVAIGATSVPHNWESARHQHRAAQLLYVVRGIINCEIENGVWIVPPQCAIWIPPEVPHSMRGSGSTECYCLFAEPSAATNLPQSCGTLGVSTLLRELINKAAGFSSRYTIDGPEGRLVATLLDELVAAPIEGLYLPLPRDIKLRRLADLLLADPADKASIGDWAERIGMSVRSMSRILRAEIGMSFGNWRRQLHVILAIQLLTSGTSVQEIAFDLGYENSSGFITMFRKAVGKPPARYLSDHRSTNAADEAPFPAPISMS